MKAKTVPSKHKELHNFNHDIQQRSVCNINWVLPVERKAKQNSKNWLGIDKRKVLCHLQGSIICSRHWSLSDSHARDAPASNLLLALLRWRYVRCRWGRTLIVMLITAIVVVANLLNTVVRSISKLYRLSCFIDWSARQSSCTSNIFLGISTSFFSTAKQLAEESTSSGRTWWGTRGLGARGMCSVNSCAQEAMFSTNKDFMLLAKISSHVWMASCGKRTSCN